MASFVEFQTADCGKITVNVEQIVYFHASPRDETVTEIALPTGVASERMYVQASYAAVRDALHERS